MLPPSVTQLQSRFTGIAIKALAIIVMMVAAFAYGQHVRQAEIDAAARDTAIAYAGKIVELQEENEILSGEIESGRKQRSDAVKTITKEVIRYAQHPDHCRLPGDFRLLHDAAATGDAAFAGPGSLDASGAEPVEDVAVIDTVTENYAACRETEARLIAWQRRYLMLELSR